MRFQARRETELKLRPRTEVSIFRSFHWHENLIGKALSTIVLSPRECGKAGMEKCQSGRSGAPAPLGEILLRQLATVGGKTLENSVMYELRNFSFCLIFLHAKDPTKKKFLLWHFSMTKARALQFTFVRIANLSSQLTSKISRAPHIKSTRASTTVSHTKSHFLSAKIITQKKTFSIFLPMR